MSIRTLRRIGALALVVAAGAVATLAQPAAATFHDKDCSDFKTHRQAQRYFKNHGGPRHDPSHLDADHDGIACEDLP